MIIYFNKKNFHKLFNIFLYELKEINDKFILNSFI